MKHYSCYEFYKDIDRMINTGEYKKALDLMEDEMDFLPKEDFEIHKAFFLNVKAYGYRLCGMFDKAMDLYERMIEQGISTSKAAIERIPPDQNGRLTTIKNKNSALIGSEAKYVKTQCKVYLPQSFDNSRKYPLFLALHQGGDNINILEWYWKPDAFINKEYILVYIQSSQFQRSGSFLWLNDMIRAREDIRNCYMKLLETYNIDENNVVIGGFSCGAIAAIDMAMTQTIPVKGFIAVSPYDIPDTLKAENIKNVYQRGVRGVVIRGEDELSNIEDNDVIKILKDNKFIFEYYINKGVIYYSAEDLSERFEQALDFIG